MKLTYVVMAHRTSGSVFGAASSPCKRADGNLYLFDSMDAARKYLNSITAGLQTSNVYYTVEEVTQ